MKLEDVKSIGVVGAGVMGGGISQSAILAGYKVICRDLTDEILERTRDTIANGRFGIKGGVERGKQTQEEMDQAMARLTLTTKVEDLKDCDLIIEAIGGGENGQLENKPLKLKVWAELDKLVKKEAAFASNTSVFTIADLAVATERKDIFVGMHLFSPANIMKLVEVTYTADTSEETIKLIEDLSKSMGKTPVRVKDVPGDTGFIGNRVFGAARREAQKIVDEGIATAEDVDTAMMLGFNWPAGPIGMGLGARSGWKK
ncbi:MAG TPA: 3-hydroxyacyl-CoA dehydrogenase family protein [Dehalococcoidales bacterium]|nr:3-hydroxyacyl-CoA dehydrogenase family protein [Dehalococcoidales bacterium]